MQSPLFLCDGSHRHELSVLTKSKHILIRVMVMSCTECRKLPCSGFALVDELDMSRCRSRLRTALGLARSAEMTALLDELGLEIGDGVVALGGAVDVLDERRVAVVVDGLLHLCDSVVGYDGYHVSHVNR